MAYVRATQAHRHTTVKNSGEPDMAAVVRVVDNMHWLPRPRLSPAEIREAVRILMKRVSKETGKLMNNQEVARIIGCADRTVVRHRKEIKAREEEDAAKRASRRRTAISTDNTT